MRKDKNTLMSNQFMTVSIHTDENVLKETNMNRGYGLDPLDLLIKLEDLASDLYERTVSSEPQADFIRREINRRVDLI